MLKKKERGCKMGEKEIKRKCIACNSLKSRDELVKITINNKKEIKVMPDSKFFGRSAYICKNDKCLETAFKKDKIYKILKTKPAEDLKEKIRAVLEN